ncbi:MAG: glycosyltransferase, partial [Duncaniella sp.]|nr:glycosyltransferase [Duncaniella sp.]
VSTNNGGQAEYLEDGRTALLVNPGDDEALAGAIARVIDDPQLRERLARAGKEYFDNHMSYSMFADKVLEAYS